METKVQLLNALVVALIATYLVSSVSCSRLLQSNPAAAADATSGEHDSLPSQEVHGVEFQELVHVQSNPAQTSTPAEKSKPTYTPYEPDYETHDNSPGFNGRRR